MKRTRTFLPVILMAGVFAFAMGCGDDDNTNNNTGPICNNDGICDADQGETASSCNDCVVTCTLEGISGDSHDFLVSELFVPDSTTSAKENGVDIDGDGEIDNKLGSIISLIASQGGDFDVNELVNEQITDGSLLLIGRVYVDQWGGDDQVLAQVFQGEVVDASPLFDGNDTVAIADSSPTDIYLCGRMVGDELQAGPDNLRIVIPIPDIITLDITLTKAQMIGDVDADGMYDVMIGGGIAKSEITKLYSDAVDLLNDMITDPESSESTVSTILDIVDDNCETTVDGCDPLPAGCAEDGVITVDELQCNALLDSALKPDVDFGDDDPSNDLISLGLKIVSAVPVTVQE